jgi:hypothetical protein
MLVPIFMSRSGIWRKLSLTFHHYNILELILLSIKNEWFIITIGNLTIYTIYLFILFIYEMNE